jgi:Mg-chelatase subunit ChlD
MRRRSSAHITLCLNGTARAPIAVTLGLIAIPWICACKDASQSSSSAGSAASTGAGFFMELPAADQGLCTGVVILIDTSGSMAQTVRDRDGRKRPKHEIARDALRRIVDFTGTWSAAHRDRPLQLGVFRFSSSASPVLPMGAFNQSTAASAIAAIPGPGGGTAIGEALKDAFRALYASGCVRKHVVCITDGENTSGAQPDWVARGLFAQTHGEVELHFVAFDMSASHFAFLKNVNGHAVEAADGEQLAAKLSEIYEKRILAEAMPAEKAEK